MPEYLLFLKTCHVQCNTKKVSFLFQFSFKIRPLHPTLPPKNVCVWRDMMARYPSSKFGVNPIDNWESISPYLQCLFQLFKTFIFF